MKKSDYVKQLEDANQLLQQKLEEANLKLEEGNIREKCLQLRPKRMLTLNGYEDIKTAKEYVRYKNKPYPAYPDNSRYPDYMYWCLPFDKNTKRNEDFCNHFMYQMRRYMGIPCKVGTNCKEPWLDDKIMGMSILVINWYRVLSAGGIFKKEDNGDVYIGDNHNTLVCRSYIIERGNPQVYLYRGKAITPAIRIQP